MTNDKDKNKAYSDENTALPPDEETLHTPDPQKNMEGPVSSSIKNIAKSLSGDETQKEADEERDKNM